MSKRKRNLLDAILTESHSAVCVLDAERRIRFFSPGMKSLTGWNADEIEGLACLQKPSPNSSNADLLTTALSPSLSVFDGSIQTIDTVLPRKAGTSIRVHVTFVPINDADGSVQRILILCDPDRTKSVTKASLSQQLHAEITALRIEFRRRFSEQSFFGKCPEITRALKQAELLKAASCGYSIVGPSGSGRRHFAKLVHVSGHNSEESLVPLDCRLLTADQVLQSLQILKQLRESESASASHQNAGTLLLVDADRCPREVQAWILEHLEAELSSIRVVSTSEQPLQQAMSEGWLIAEFHQLFQAVEVTLPPLHSRGNDIKLLTQHFVSESLRLQETSAQSVSEEVMAELMFYRWPGNVRELQKVISLACQNSFNNKLEVDDMPFSFTAGIDAQKLPPTPEKGEQSLDAILQQFEIDVLQKTLEACRGNKAEAARRLGLTRPKLYRRLKTLGIDTEE